ncbi:unnamed protein product [Macrosiphum euphorbiae]|uniref:Cytochrome P450 n=1 Tax=Macrosiphum euphorbiae TaxID=13131 RepID=A0AAV0WXR4_9HEMI|nr:unnamed protein product [Macrosiphum euphorbiae]
MICFSCWLEIVPIAAIASALLTYVYCTRYYGHWTALGVPHTKPAPLLGHFAGPTMGRESGTITVDKLYRRFTGHRYFGVYQLRHPMLVLRDPVLVHAVLATEFSSFHDRMMSRTSFEHDGLFNSLVNLRGDKWKAVRAKLSPTFTVAKLKAMFASLHVCTGQLADKLLLLTSGGQGIVNVTDISSKFTIDTIGRCAFGINCNTLFDSNTEFQRAGQAVFTPTRKSSVLNFMRLVDLGWLVDLFRLRSMPDLVYEFYSNLFQDTLELRKNEKEDRNDFVSILIKLRNDEKKNNSRVELFTDDVLASNAFIFFAAGFETTASAMSYCLYELALNQDIQVELRKQIQHTLNENEGILTYDVIKDMKYLDMVLNETLRMHPPGPGLLRVCTKKFKIPDSDITLDTGMKVLIPTYSLHHDPAYYPNPELFDPLRFTEDNKASRPNGTFLPFGDGPRICIGLRFALMEAKTGLAEIISKFEIFPCKYTKIPIKLNPRSILLTPNEPISLLFKQIV